MTENTTNELITYLKSPKNGTPKEVYDTLEDQPIEVQVQALIKAMKWQGEQMNKDYLIFKETICERLKGIENRLTYLEAGSDGGL